jgi:hypothetical protein
VLLCAYSLFNVRLMLLSGIGKPYDSQTGQGVVGRNYAYQTLSGVSVILKDKVLNPFVASGGIGMMVDDYNGDNFDHSGLGFIGGGFIGAGQTNGRSAPVPRIGARNGRRPRPRPTIARWRFRRTVVPTAIAIASLISIRLTRTGLAVR